MSLRMGGRRTGRRRAAEMIEIDPPMPGRPTILVAEAQRFSPQAVARLEQVGRVRLEDLDRAGLLAGVAGADVLWVRLRHRIDEEVLAAGPGLRAVVTPTTGLDHLDLEAAERRGVRVLALRGEVDFLREIRATAELAIGLMLALLRNLPEAAKHVRDGGWDRDRFRGRELHEKTVGVVGLGRLGTIVAGYLRAFGCEVLAADPHRAPAEVPEGCELTGLDDLLRRAHLVSLHVSLSDATRGLLGAAELGRMREGAWLVNTARGELVDEQALLGALRSGRLAGAALDVLRDERPAGMAEHPLVRHAREHSNLLITPHIGGATAESMAKTERFLADRLAAILEDDA
jgi:D-3-phosphoglycerate dehydrogenase / 2-oxoglutarate reductase